MRLYATCLLFLLLRVFRAVSASLYGEGCEEGWMHYGHFCYSIHVNETSYDKALTTCEDLEADLTSVWTKEERAFITDTLWQGKLTSAEFAWFGLHGTNDNDWEYLDKSDVIMKGGVLTSSSGEPANKVDRCGAFMGTGGLAFLDCNGMMAEGFICKKALPRVFANSALLNHTIPDNPSATASRGAQLFERVWPPLLLEFPRPTHYLAEDDTDSETGCAFRCFNVHGCNAFQVTCITSDMCKTVTCTLLTQI